MIAPKWLELNRATLRQYRLPTEFARPGVLVRVDMAFLGAPQLLAALRRWNEGGKKRTG